MLEFVTGSKLVVVEGGPHNIGWTHTEIMNRELLEFLGRGKPAQKVAGAPKLLVRALQLVRPGLQFMAILFNHVQRPGIRTKLKNELSQGPVEAAARLSGRPREGSRRSFS